MGLTFSGVFVITADDEWQRPSVLGVTV